MSTRENQSFNLFIALQKLLPRHGLSRFGGRMAASEHPALSQLLIKYFLSRYDVDLSEAERSDILQYRSFNDFFTRALRPGARPISATPGAIVSPADGAVSQCGAIEADCLLQAKGHRYSIEALTGGVHTGRYSGGAFCTIYLAPTDYHRVHMPFAGKLMQSIAIPGDLYSVNATTEQHIDGLFARNERLVCEFQTELGNMLVVLVGAMVVASIETVWGGPASPYRSVQRTDHSGDNRHLAAGEEMGRFLLGSTVILCFEAGRGVDFGSLKPGQVTRMGAQLA